MKSARLGKSCLRVRVVRAMDAILMRPGAPTDFEATIIFEFSMEDRNGRTIFARTIKEDKFVIRYGYEGYRIVMQEAVDELFTKLGEKLVHSPEIQKFVSRQ